MAALNLIRVFDVYLILGFILGIVLRARQYSLVVGVILAAPKRWPKLIELANENRRIFVAWRTLVPIGLTFALLLAHTLALRLVWVTAELTPLDLWRHWVALILLVALGAVMLYLDYDATFNIGEINRAALEKDLDRAEYWLSSWAGPAVKIVTLGFVNPRKMVHEEVHKALTDATREVNRQMWLWALQVAVRLAFGLCLWLTWFWAVS